MKQLMYLSVELNDAAGVDEDRYCTPTHPDGGEWRLVKATWTPDTAVAVDASDYRTIALKNGATTLGSLTTNSSGGAAFVEGAPQAFSLSGGTAREFTANTDALEIDSAKTGATGKVAVGRVGLCFERVS